MQAHALAFFGMELDADDVVASADRGVGLTVIGFAQDAGRVIGDAVIGMDEVEEGVFGQAAKNRVVLFKLHLVPADVRDVNSLWKPDNLAGQQSQAFVNAEFVALVEHHLQSDAEADDWLARLSCFDDEAVEVMLPETVHAGGEGSDAGKNEFICFFQDLLIACDDCIDPLRRKCLLHAAKISDTVINDCDRHF